MRPTLYPDRKVKPILNVKQTKLLLVMLSHYDDDCENPVLLAEIKTISEILRVAIRDRNIVRKRL